MNDFQPVALYGLKGTTKSLAERSRVFVCARILFPVPWPVLENVGHLFLRDLKVLSLRLEQFWGLSRLSFGPSNDLQSELRMASKTSAAAGDPRSELRVAETS